MTRQVLYGGDVVDVEDVDPYHAKHGPGDVVYAVWPLYRPEQHYICVANGAYRTPSGPDPDAVWFDRPENFRRLTNKT